MNTYELESKLREKADNWKISELESKIRHLENKIEKLEGIIRSHNYDSDDLRLRVVKLEEENINRS